MAKANRKSTRDNSQEKGEQWGSVLDELAKTEQQRTDNLRLKVVNSVGIPANKHSSEV